MSRPDAPVKAAAVVTLAAPAGEESQGVMGAYSKPPSAMAAGVATEATAPAPERGTVRLGVDPLFGMVRVAVWVPLVVGVKTIVMAQLADVNAAGQEFEAMANSLALVPDMDGVPIDTAADVGLEIETNWGTLVVFTT